LTVKKHICLSFSAETKNIPQKQKYKGDIKKTFVANFLTPIEGWGALL
jgi:hypothetical protein